MSVATTAARCALPGQPMSVTAGSTAQTTARCGSGSRAVVVTPDRRIAMKGTGELEPGRKVGFLVYAWDGAPDRLRMVIWDAADAATPDRAPAIYDNRPGPSWDLDRIDPQSVDLGQVIIT